MLEKSKPIGRIPTPYGKMIDVFFDRSKHVDEDLCYFHDINGCMDLMGIHDEESRKKCAQAVKDRTIGNKVNAAVFMEFGGHTIPRIGLPAGDESIYRRFTFPDEAQNVIENWVDMALETSNWTNRATRFIDVGIAQAIPNMEEWKLPADISRTVMALSMGHMITSSLEHLHEKEIDCLEAAAIYALTLHDGWRSSAVEWLKPFRKTWFKDWKRERPVYRKAASLARSVHSDLPAWLGSDA